MNVLVAGANGHTGRIIVQLLGKAPNHEAFAMIRDESQADESKALGAKETIVADLEQDLSHAVKGMDAVIFAAGSGSKTGPEKTIAVDQEGAKRLVDAAKQENIERFVMLSTYGADNPQGPIANYLEAKGVADRYLQESGLAYTIVRPGPLSFDDPAGTVTIGEGLQDVRDHPVSRADVAHIIVSCLDLAQARNKVFEIIGGDDPIEDALKKI
ncbi:SDR family oxidoreductase [Caldalkalibacillus salinus]|uniref:SDR family oxidoreductase n=1 Tax=Caldalkalibacillus salinus TaxID=2803787 RepID=UPI00192350C7|nr:SDR family oxidoreductase [Caldalkalibacillus salinus]